MRLRFSLTLLVIGVAVVPCSAGSKFHGAFLTGVTYENGTFVAREPTKGRPPLLTRKHWTEEKTEMGSLVKMGTGYLTADENGIVTISATSAPGSYWTIVEHSTTKGRYDDKTDWTGTWMRTTYTLVSKNLDGKLGFRDGKLTVHPKNEGVAILSTTLIDAITISGK